MAHPLNETHSQQTSSSGGCFPANQVAQRRYDAVHPDRARTWVKPSRRDHGTSPDLNPMVTTPRNEMPQMSERFEYKHLEKTRGKMQATSGLVFAIRLTGLAMVGKTFGFGYFLSCNLK